MSGFAQGLLAGFSTVDQAMTRRKELGLREAQLAQQQKNNERDFEFAQSQFEHNKDVDQRNFDYRAKVDDRNYALQEREFNANQNYRNASLGMEQQRLQLQKYNQRRLEYNDMLARDQPVMAALGKAVDAGDRDAAMHLYGQLSEGNPLRLMNRPGFPGECFICELRLPDHYFRWKHNKLFLLLPEEYGPAFPAIVDCYTSPPT